jgi:hypothetical protein
MNHSEFKIGENFFAQAGFEWQCTDIGTRTILAVLVNPEPFHEFIKGPPYISNEKVFDENEIKNCYKNLNDELLDSLRGSDSAHPGFSPKDLKILNKDLFAKRNYRYPKLFRFDRVGEDGRIYHPYMAEFDSKKEEWYILVFEIFSKKTSSIHENVFATLKVCEEEDLIKRRDSFAKNKGDI